MEPFAISVRGRGEWVVIHRCIGSGELKSNRAAGDDSPLLLLRLAVRPLAMPPFPLDLLAESNRRVGTRKPGRSVFDLRYANPRRVKWPGRAKNDTHERERAQRQRRNEARTHLTLLAFASRDSGGSQSRNETPGRLSATRGLRP